MIRALILYLIGDYCKKIIHNMYRAPKIVQLELSGVLSVSLTVVPISFSLCAWPRIPIWPYLNLDSMGAFINALS